MTYSLSCALTTEAIRVLIPVQYKVQVAPHTCAAATGLIPNTSLDFPILEDCMMGIDIL
jgi:hypothetical protein